MCSKSMPMKDHSSLANQLAWWVVCVVYILSKLKDSFSCSLLYYVKTIEDFDTIQCVICVVFVRGLLIQPSCVRLTWYIFLSLKELRSPSQATMTPELVDRTLQSGLRWFSFSLPNCVSPPQHSNHAIVFYAIFLNCPRSIHSIAISPWNIYFLFSLDILASLMSESIINYSK